MDIAVPQPPKDPLAYLGLPATATIGAIEYPQKVRVAIVSDEQIVPGFLQCVTAAGERLTVNVTKLKL